ncbi:MAG: hypothetical protein LBT14_05690 [Treponema sp.]|nr:hypothetical protein [Treponema sp.]
MKPVGSVVLMLTLLAMAAHAQSSSSTTSNTTGLVSTEFDTTGFPRWVKDLRRAEIVAFGSFPFTMFFATFAVDSYRYVNNSWDTRYAPWPFKSAGAVEMTKKEQITTIAVAAVGSIIISLADFLIVTYKRHKQARDINNLPDGSPIIIRKPWPAEEPGVEALNEPGEPGTAGASEVGSP